MKKMILVLFVTMFPIAACSGNQMEVEPELYLTPTLVQVISSPTIVRTQEPDAKPALFVDSGQRLGNGRSWDVSLGDVDGDGDLDAFVVNDDSGEISSEVWLNDGKGVFTQKTQELDFGNGLDMGDLDNDGDMDIFIVGLEEEGQIWLNDGSGIFTDSGQRLGEVGGWDVSLGDIDADGDLDAFIAHTDANTVWLNDGAGIFQDSSQ